jgi:hypothetical protein
VAVGVQGHVNDLHVMRPNEVLGDDVRCRLFAASSGRGRGVEAGGPGSCHGWCSSNSEGERESEKLGRGGPRLGAGSGWERWPWDVYGCGWKDWLGPRDIERCWWRDWRRVVGIRVQGEVGVSLKANVLEESCGWWKVILEVPRFVEHWCRGR